MIKLANCILGFLYALCAPIDFPANNDVKELTVAV
jgi:hypothetical protein